MRRGARPKSGFRESVRRFPAARCDTNIEFAEPPRSSAYAVKSRKEARDFWCSGSRESPKWRTIHAASAT